MNNQTTDLNEMKALIQQLISERAKVKDSEIRVRMFHQIDEAVKAFKSFGGVM